MTLRLEGRLRLEQVDDLVLRVRQPAWKSTSVSRRTGIATPSSKRRGDGVEVDATIQHERQNFRTGVNRAAVSARRRVHWSLHALAMRVSWRATFFTKCAVSASSVAMRAFS